MRGYDQTGAGEAARSDLAQSDLAQSGAAQSGAAQSGVVRSDHGPSGIHATTVAFGPDRGVMILGASGTGKSALALRLMTLGAQLVADDRTLLLRQGDALVASAPAPLAGLIEAWGIGVIRVVPLDRARLVLAIDMDHITLHRMPPPQSHSWLGITLPLLHKVGGGHFPAAILHYIASANLDPI